MRRITFFTMLVKNPANDCSLAGPERSSSDNHNRPCADEARKPNRWLVKAIPRSVNNLLNLSVLLVIFRIICLFIF